MTYLDFRAAYMEEVEMLRHSDDPNAVGLRERDDYRLGEEGMLRKVIANLQAEKNHSKRGRYFKKAKCAKDGKVLLDKVIKNFMDILKAVQNGTAPPQLLWEGQEELPPDNDSYEELRSKHQRSRNKHLMNSRAEIRALFLFHCDEVGRFKDWGLPRRFIPVGYLSYELNMERLKNRAEHGLESIYQMLLLDYPEFKLSLTQKERNSLDGITTEQKKVLCLKFLRERRYVSEKYTPIIFVPRDEFSLDATDEEIAAFWEKIVPLLEKNKPRINAELESRDDIVSVFAS